MSHPPPSLDASEKLRASPPSEPSGKPRLSASDIHEKVRAAGEEELRRPAAELAWSAVNAGITMGLSLVASAYLASLAGPEHKEAAAAAGYPLAFIIVVLARSQLFTENTLYPVIPVLHRRTGAAVGRLLRLWGVVLLGNLGGALLFALLAARTAMLDAPLRAEMLTVAEHGTDGGFWQVGYRAIFGGWLVALMAWLVSATRYAGAQIALVWLATAPIAAFGFRHSIAGAVEAFYRAWSGHAAWAAMLGEFLVPALIGNVIGGVTLVALLNHAQVVAKDD